MYRALAAARVAGASCAGVGVLLAASGWLYLIRTHTLTSGARVGDALPLDELSRHSAVGLPAFLAVWSGAAVLLALLARWARIERLTAALLLAGAVGGWTYAATGASLLVVRQIPAEDAFHATTGLRAVWLPAVLAGALWAWADASGDLIGAAKAALAAVRALGERPDAGGKSTLLSLVAGQLEGAERDQACAVFRARLSSGDIEACP